MPDANKIGAISTEMIWNAEKRLNITVDHCGKTYRQTVYAKSFRNGLRKARAVIALRDFDAAFHGSYSVNM